MVVKEIKVRDNYSKELKEIKVSMVLIQQDIAKVKVDLIEIKENTKKELS